MTRWVEGAGASLQSGTAGGFLSRKLTGKPTVNNEQSASDVLGFV